MAPIRRVVLDLLKPHDPSPIELASRVADCSGVQGANATLLERDREVENIKLTVEGEDIDYGAVVEAAEGLGASVHSIDEVVCGDRVIETSATPQD